MLPKKLKTGDLIFSSEGCYMVTANDERLGYITAREMYYHPFKKKYEPASMKSKIFYYERLGGFTHV